MRGNPLSRVLLSLAALALAIAVPVQVHAQTSGTISGRVTSAESGQPLSGASIEVVGSQLGGLTGADGRYTITDVDAGTHAVRVRVIGFAEQQQTVNVPAGQTASADFQLETQVVELEGLVAVGYGAQRKVNLTGSVESVEGEDLEKRPVANVSEALQGTVPGLTVIDRGGRPGAAGTDIKIRGIGTLGNANPLVLIDGLEGNLNDVAATDIATVTVLKDAASAAIYGSRAANGVILVTTKRGTATNELNIAYSGYYGIQDVVGFPEHVGMEDYFEIINETYRNAGQEPKYSDEYIQNTLNGTDPLQYPSTSWLDVMFDPAPMQDHSIRISGGNDLAVLSLSLNYLKQDGMIPNTDADRFGVRLNTDWTFSDRFSGLADVSLRRTSDSEPSMMRDALFRSIHDIMPTITAQYPDGSYGWSSSGHNPLAYAEASGLTERGTYRGTASGQLSYDLFDGLAVRTKAAIDYDTRDYTEFQTEQTFYNYYDPTVVEKTWSPNFLDEREEDNREITLQALIDYSRTFGNHNLTGLLGYEQIVHDYEEVRARREGFYNNDLREINAGDANRQETWGTSSSWRLRSGFARLGYDYLGRYLLEANARYDGSSRFAEGSQYGFFPSFSAGWRITEEPWLGDTGWLSELKLRGSWGRLGNQQIGLYRYYTTIALGRDYPFAGTLNQGAEQTRLGNQNITWETTETTNFGVDAGFFDNRLTFAGDVYQKNTTGILLTLPISRTIGLDAPVQNAGAVKNTGWETSLSWRDAISDFEYSFAFNLSDVKNEVTDLADTGPYIGWGGGEANRYYVLQEGTNIGALYGYEADGFFQSEEEVAAHARQDPRTEPGDIRYKDQNGDGVINAEDNIVIGTTLPHYTTGLNFGASYKGFDASLFFQGVLKVDTYVFGSFAEGPVFENYVTPAWLDRWSPENPDAAMPRPRIRTNINTRPVSSFWVQDAKYVKLKNAQIGYSLPPSILDRLGVERLRVFVTGNNLLTWTNLRMTLDPEVETGRATGYPQTRVISIGTDVSF